MKKDLSKLLIALMLFFMPELTSGQAITLGSASEFVVFTTAGAITNSGTNYQTRLTGKVGSNSGSSTGFGNVNGTMHSGDAFTIAAAASLLTAYNQLNTATPTAFPSSSLGNGAVFNPGVYSISTAATLSGILTLDGLGNTGSVFIIKINGALSVSANSKVRLTNGAQACNVYWKTEGLVSIGSGSTIRGTIVANSAAINMGTLDTLEGRALSLNGAITMNSLTGDLPLGCGSPTLTGPIAPTFGAVGVYAIFSSIGPVTNGGAITYVTGDVGTNLGLTTGYNPLYVNGTIHPIPDGSTAAAVPALSVAYNQLNALPNDIVLLYPALLGHGLVLTPHTYILNGATALTDTLYLNAQGNSSAVFVIKVQGALNTVSGAYVKLINGTQTKNVYWKVDGAVSLTSNTTFHGNVVVSVGAIDIPSGAIFNGRALTSNGAITTNGAIINAPLLPTAVITGDTTVCIGTPTQLLGVDPGGVWTATNARATVSNTGLVTGVSAGLDSIIYTVTNSFGTARDTQLVNVLATPNAGTISGPSSVCVASSIILSSTSPGGIWTASNPRVTVVNGLVTGITSGIDTISYIITNTCGSDTSTKIVNVYDSAIVNTPTNQVVCNGASTAPVVFSGPISGTTYTWTNNNATIGIAASGNGNIPSFTATNSTASPVTATITVTPSANGCTGASKSFTIRVNPTPNVAVVPDQVVCNNTSTAATNYTSTVSGTNFAWTNDNSTIGLASAGNGNIPAFIALNSTNVPAIANIVVTPSANGCTGLARTFDITVNPTPDVAAISNQVVCNNALTTAVNYTGTVSGTAYTWTNNNATIGIAASGNGNIPSFTATNNTASPVTATITVTPSANGCPGASVAFTITVNPTPNVAIVSDQIVCNGASTAPVNYTGIVSGTNFTWTNDNNTIGLASAGNGNIPSFIAINSTNVPTIANIVVTPSANGCTGLARMFDITVNPTPDVAAIPNQVVCNNNPTTAVNYTGTVSGTTYTWTNDNTAIGLASFGNGDIPSFTATNNTSNPVVATITVTPSANGCPGASMAFTITVNPTPDVAIVPDQIVCNGASTAPINYTSTVSGTSFAWTNDNSTIGLAGTGNGNIPPFIALNNTANVIVATITVIPSANGCIGFASTFTITVNPTPNAPVLSLTTPPSVCNMTYFRNFGAATLPPAGMEYTWSTVNAAISDTGSTTQYALVNFKNPGIATVILTGTVINTGCLNTTSYNVEVTPNVADVPAEVIYFNNSFVCLQNNEEAYAWGFDDASTLAPTSIAGEMNQDYVNASPNLATNRYWVMVSHNGCIQKTYYNMPEGAQMKIMPLEIKVTPNPASQQIKVSFNTISIDKTPIEIYSMLGQKMYMTNDVTNITTVDISSFPIGVYLIIAYRNNEKITTRFIKN